MKAEKKISRTYRRRSIVRSQGDAVLVDIEDYQHRFALVLGHNGRVIQSVDGHSIRTPWAICPGANSVLGNFVGLELERSPFAMMRKVDIAMQCTHLADMACLAAAAAARGAAPTIYDVAITVTAFGEEDFRESKISINGEAVFSWRLLDGVIQEPDPFAGLEIRRTAKWAHEHIADENRLAALFAALRTFMVSNGLRYDEIESFDHAAKSKVGRNACYSMQEIRIADASRNLNSVRVFESQDHLLTDLDNA